MTPLLEEALAAVEQLSPDTQDDIARWILAELANRQQWEAALMVKVEAYELMAAGDSVTTYGIPKAK